MLARWGSFSVGLGLVLAPLALGYGHVAPILHDVAAGALVCVAALAALEWPVAQLAVAACGAWLVLSGRAAPDRTVTAAELAAGALLLALSAGRVAAFLGGAAARGRRATMRG